MAVLLWRLAGWLVGLATWLKVLLSSAAVPCPWQVRRLFSRCFIVGRAFPICHVHHEGVIIEVRGGRGEGRGSAWAVLAGGGV